MDEENGSIDILKQIRTTGVPEELKVYTPGQILRTKLSEFAKELLDVIIHENTQGKLPDMKEIEKRLNKCSQHKYLKELKNKDLILDPSDIEIYHVFKQLDDEDFKFGLNNGVIKEIGWQVKGNYKGGATSQRKALQKPRALRRKRYYLALVTDEEGLPVYHNILTEH